MFRPCSSHVSIVLEVCFNRARSNFRQCSRYVSIRLDVSLNCAGAILLLRLRSFVGAYSKYVLTVLEVFSKVLEVRIDRARCMFRTCSRYVLTLLEVHSNVLDVYLERA